MVKIIKTYDDDVRHEVEINSFLKTLVEGSPRVTNFVTLLPDQKRLNGDMELYQNYIVFTTFIEY